MCKRRLAKHVMVHKDACLARRHAGTTMMKSRGGRRSREYSTTGVFSWPHQCKHCHCLQSLRCTSMRPNLLPVCILRWANNRCRKDPPLMATDAQVSIDLTTLWFAQALNMPQDWARSRMLVLGPKLGERKLTNTAMERDVEAVIYHSRNQKASRLRSFPADTCICPLCIRRPPRM